MAIPTALVDYSFPMLQAEKSMKKLHDAMLRKDYDAAWEHGMNVIAETRLVMIAVKHEKESSDGVRLVS